MSEEAIYDYIKAASEAGHNITGGAPDTDKEDDETDEWGIV